MALNTHNIIVEQGIDGYLISSVIELPGCHTQAESLDELYKRTKEAIEVYIDGKKRYRLVNKSIAFFWFVERLKFFHNSNLC